VFSNLVGQLGCCSGVVKWWLVVRRVLMGKARNSNGGWSVQLQAGDAKGRVATRNQWLYQTSAALPMHARHEPQASC